MKLAHANVHFIGIGGIGMSGIAEVLHVMGASVTGSDMGLNVQVERLRSLGVRVSIGHQPQNITDADVIVYSSAVKANNPEYQEARRKKIPLIPRAEALAEIMRLKRGVAIAGSHGKTTTTSLAASVFMQSDLKPTVIVGGRLDKIKSTAVLGEGEWMIAEADESDGSFLKLSPELAVITNIDSDHMDHYGSFDALKRTFYDFASSVPFYGALIACGDDLIVREVFRDFPKKTVFYGFNQDNDYLLKRENGLSFVYHHGECLGSFQLGLPGDHNALNALASLIVGLEAGLDFESCARGLSRFEGVDRRFQKIGENNGVLFYDDYGHHPTEIQAVLKAFKEKFPDRRLIVSFQPHRYSRTESCWGDFLKCFVDADKVFLLDVYAAGEVPRPDISSERLASEVEHSACSYVGGVDSCVEEIRTQLRSNDLFVTLGAGDGWRVGRALLDMGT